LPERPSSACSSSTLRGDLPTSAPGAYLPAVSASGTCAYRRAARAARRPDLMDKPSLQTALTNKLVRARAATPAPLSEQAMPTIHVFHKAGRMHLSWGGSLPGISESRSNRRARVPVGRLNHDQGQLFYSFSLEEAVLDDHLVRKIAAVLDLSWVHAELAPHYPNNGRPSIDPELMIRMLIIGYVFAIRYCLISAPTRLSCCARAMSGHATAAPPSSVMNSRRLN
jgi:hypothetical protein